MKSMNIWKVSCSSSTNIHCVKIFTLNSWMPWSYHNDKLLTWEKKEGKEKKKLQQKIGGLVPTTPKLLLHLWQNSLHFSQSLSASSQGIWPHPDLPLDILLDLLNVRHEQDVCTRPQLLPTRVSCCSAAHLLPPKPPPAMCWQKVLLLKAIGIRWEQLLGALLYIYLHPNWPWWQAPTRSLQLRAVAALCLSHKEGHHPPAASLPPTASSCSNHHLLPIAS